MSKDTRSLLALTLYCTLAATLFGFGAVVYSFRSAYEELGREPLIQATSILVYLSLALILVFKGGWRGTLAALLMVIGATAISWSLLPLSLGLASIEDPESYAERFASFSQPSYWEWAVFDIVFVGGGSALAQGLRVMVNVNPRGSRDE